MAKVECVPVEAWHVDYIVEHAREADRMELRELNGVSIRQGLDASLAQPGKHWTGLIDGVPVAIFGVVPVTVTGGAGVCWLLGTPSVVEHWRIFARHSRRLMAELLDRYDVLLNVVHARNYVAVRWLQWMGATFKRNGNQVYFELRGNRETRTSKG